MVIALLWSTEILHVELLDTASKSGVNNSGLYHADFGFGLCDGLKRSLAAERTLHGPAHQAYGAVISLIASF